MIDYMAKLLVIGSFMRLKHFSRHERPQHVTKGHIPFHYMSFHRKTESIDIQSSPFMCMHNSIGMLPQHTIKGVPQCNFHRTQKHMDLRFQFLTPSIQFQRSSIVTIDLKQVAFQTWPA